MIENLPINEYHARPEISSTLLKTIMISPAHLQYVLENGFKPTKATILGDAIHAWLMEPKRFFENYEQIEERYLHSYKDFKAGDAKLDEDGNPIVYYKHKTNSKLDIKGEEYKKLIAVSQAVSKSKEALRLLDSAKYIEASFFCEYNGLKLKVRPDFITEDGWIVDIKSVGGESNKPSAPDSFARKFFDLCYDIQMFMYYNVVKKEMPDIKGFKFLCVDAKQPSGVQIYTFIDGESKWFELGGYRFHEALDKLDRYKKESIHKVYENENVSDLPLSYSAEDYLVRARAE